MTGLSPHKLEEISLGTLLYGLLFCTEGTGLVLGKRWAEYVAVISTAGFLPVEVYEIFHKFRWTKVVVLILNIAIVVYLIVRLWQTRPATEKDQARRAIGSCCTWRTTVHGIADGQSRRCEPSRFAP